MSEGQMRRRSAERKRRKSQQLWGAAEAQLDTSWQKWTRCSICDKRICINNYPDRRIRVAHLRYKKLIICPWCKGHNGKRSAELILKMVAIAKTTALHTKKCNCEACDARRFLVEEYPQVAKFYSLKKKPNREHHGKKEKAKD